jgi:Trypsin-like peptidase domain
MFDIDLMRRLSSAAAITEAEVDQLRANREGQDASAFVFENLDTPDARIPGLTDDQVAALISAEARDMVIGFEVGSRQLYEKKYTDPEWPKGSSGVTIGIGYDVGYQTADEVRKHWGGLIGAGEIQRLVRAVGVKGPNAGAIISDFRGIRVPWDAAIAAYQRSTMPKYGRLVLKAFPNAMDLHAHSFGALFSLAFNRGTSMDGERRSEMRNIQDFMRERRFESVPGEIKHMRRLWDGQGLAGLRKRRDTEALLFERGLKHVQVANLVGAEVQTESLQDDSRFDGDGRFYEEEEDVQGAVVRESDDIWDEVSWPDQDDDAPDYQHIANNTLAGKTFEFDGRALELLIKANAFEPSREYGRVIFALRGAELVTSLRDPEFVLRQQDRTALTLRDCRPNHKDLHCVIGVYDVTSGRLSGFASSTVPNRKAVASYKAKRQSGNMMPTGCYRLEVGWHLISKPLRKIPGCLVEMGRRKCVLRTINNFSYDLEDIWEDHQDHGDNLHPAKSEASAAFSSWGCLVVNGNYVCEGENRENGTHTGEWSLFRKALGLAKPGTGDHDREYDVVLLTGLEAAIASDLVKRGLDKNESVVQASLGRLRQGSKGERVKRLQKVLGLSQTGIFDHEVAKTWTDLQKKDHGGKATSVYSPASDQYYKFGVFDSQPVAVATAAGSARYEAAVDETQETLKHLYYDIGLLQVATQRHPGAGAVSLESIDDTNFEALHLEFGPAALIDRGADLVMSFERQLHERVCGGLRSGKTAATELTGKMDRAAADSAGSLKTYLGKAILLFVPGAGLLSEDFVDKIADAIVTVLVKPVADGVTLALGDSVELSAQWLCRRWSQRLAAPPAALVRLAKPAATAPNSPFIPASSPARTSPLSTASAVAEKPVAAASPLPSTTGKLSVLLKRIEDAAKAPVLDTASVRRYIHDLRSYLRTSDERLGEEDATRLLTVLCDSPFMEQLSGVVGGDPYAIMRSIEADLKQSPQDKASAKIHISELHTMLADARMKIQEPEVRRLLSAVRGAKMFDELSLLSDRFAARDPGLFGAVATSYAQGLIDSGRPVVAIEVLRAVERNGLITDPTEVMEADAIRGRGHKQIYVNHVKTASDAVALRDAFGAQLSEAANCYGSHYSADRPGENWYQGINYIAMLKRARRDGLTLTGKAGDVDPDVLSHALIGALTPQVPNSDNAWLIATLAEAHLANEQFDKAAEYFGTYAKHPNVDAFALNSTVRQLEEVWQIKVGTAGADAILTNLKAVLAQKENGFISLAPEERRAIKKANADQIAYSEHFESMIEGGKNIAFYMLKNIVMRGGSVGAIQKPKDTKGHAWRTVGTGFLVKGEDFGLGCDDGKSYMLTNAHVLWDGERPEGTFSSAVGLDDARVIFENDELDGRNLTYKCVKVHWQSHPDQLDATLFELDRKVDNVKPLDLAPPHMPLTIAVDKSTKGTRLAVLGHPKGGNLTIGVGGSLDEMRGTLVDKGPKGTATKPVFLHYVTPTEPGNSGSPVFEVDGWRVVALHHAGFKEGTSGLRRLGDKSGNIQANEGVHIDDIRSDAREYLEREHSAKDFAAVPVKKRGIRGLFAHAPSA